MESSIDGGGDHTDSDEDYYGPSPTKKPKLSLYNPGNLMEHSYENENHLPDQGETDSAYLANSVSSNHTQIYVPDSPDLRLDSGNGSNPISDAIDQTKEIIEISDTLEDETVNEVDSDCSFSLMKEDTLPYLATDSLCVGTSNRDQNAIDPDKNSHKTVDESTEKTPTKLDAAGLQKISSLVRDAKIISSIVPNVNYNIIYNRLLEDRFNEKRLDIVTSKLLESEEPSVTIAQSTSRPITDDVKTVMKQFPTADTDLVYAVLESLKNQPDRLQKTIEEIGLKKETNAVIVGDDFVPSGLKKTDTVLNDPVLANDPVFKDMRTVAKVFPDIDRNEIYALLEANVDKAKRVHIVVSELLRIEQRKNVVNDGDSLPVSSQNSSSGVTGNVTTQAVDLTLTEAGIEEDFEHLRTFFPDCDPNFLYTKLESMKDVNDRRVVLAGELMDKKDYPKLKDRLEKEQQQEEIPTQAKRNFTIDEFLKKFPDREKTFVDESKPVSDIYKAHANASILNDFVMFKKNYLLKTLEEHSHHFYPTFKKLSDALVYIPIGDRSKHHRFMKKRRTKREPEPAEADQYFFHEYWFTHNELNIEDFLKQKELDLKLRLQEAKEKGELYECCCCYDDECLFEDLANCPEGHLFCKVCVVRSTEAAFGEMKTRFPCITGDCDQELPLSTLQRIVPAKLFSKIVCRIQEEEVLNADIADLVTCPFCPFATVMPNPDDKVLKCLNPECLKDSCRLCQEESHIPLKCNEVESRAGTKMRTYIENKVAEAVMRKCHKCGKKFLKDSGCNMMTCMCGAKSCYFCKAQGIEYDHFNGNKKCGQTDPNAIHERDMKEAAHSAVQEYILEHPEAAGVELMSDLKDIISGYNPNLQDLNSQDQGGQEEEEFGEEEEEETDSDIDTDDDL